MTHTMRRAISVLFALTCVEYITGFIRSIITAGIFGVSAETEAFFLTYPLMLSIVVTISTVIRMTVIPIFIQVKTQSSERDKWEFAINLSNLFFVGLLGLAFVIFLCSSAFVSLVIGNYPEHTKMLAVTSLRLLSLMLIFMGMGSLISALLTAEKMFVIPAVSSVASSIFFIGLVIFLHNFFGVHILLYGVIASAFIYFAVQYTRIAFASPVRYHWHCDMHDENVQIIGALIIPFIISLIATQCARTYESFLASKSFMGSITVLNYARVISEVPARFFYAVIMTAFFPLLSEKVAGFHREEVNTYFSRLVLIILLLGIPATLFCVMFAYPLIRLLFERGAFSSLDTLHTAKAFIFFSLSITAVLISSVLVHMYCILRDIKTMAIITTLAMLFNIAINYLLWKRMSYLGLACGYSLTIILNCSVLLIVFLKKNKEIRLAIEREILYKIAGATVIMGVVILPIWHSLHVANTTFWHLLLRLGFTAIIASITYIAALSFLRVKEAQKFLSRYIIHCR